MNDLDFGVVARTWPYLMGGLGTVLDPAFALRHRIAIATALSMRSADAMVLPLSRATCRARAAALAACRSAARTVSDTPLVFNSRWASARMR